MADLSLAAISLTAEVFIAVLRTCEFISTAQGLASDAPILHWKFRIETVRLRAFGQFWGLLESEARHGSAVANPDGLEETILGTLKEMQKLFANVESLSEKFGFERLAVNQESDEAANVGDVAKQQQPRWTSKFKWAFKDKVKAERLAKDLIELNDGLYSMLRIAEFRVVDSVAQSSLLRTSASEGGARHLHDALAQETAPARNRRNQDARTQLQIGTMAQHSLKASSANATPPTGVVIPVFTSVKPMHISSENVVEYLREGPSSGRPLARLQDAAISSVDAKDVIVLIEWKDFDRAGTFSSLIAKRVEQLANLLSVESPKPSSFGVLNCLRYFKDDRHPRYGLIFELPSGVAKVEPRTLHSILPRGGRQSDSSIVPELGDRFALAQAISQSILRLHDCGWVHAGFRSSNVILFARPSSPDSMILECPYIGGFSYSRPTDPQESTLEYSQVNKEHDIYRHPDILRSNRISSVTSRHVHIRFEQRHDLYSLGVVLLEVGLWLRASALNKDHYTPEKFREKLLQAYVPKLAYMMGTIYRDVVRALLQNTSMDESEAGETPSGNASSYRSQTDHPEIDSEDNSHWAAIISRLLLCRA